MTVLGRHGERTRPISTEGWTRRVQLVREGGREGGVRTSSCGSVASPRVKRAVRRSDLERVKSLVDRGGAAAFSGRGLRR